MNKRPLLLMTLVLCVSSSLAAFAASGPRAWAPPDQTRSATPAAAAAETDDPDLPAFMQGQVDKEWYLQARSAHLDLLQGLPYDLSGGVNPRLAAIEQMQQKLLVMGPITSAAWSPLGPAPIPNGQTTTIATAVSGRVTAIAIHPTNPNTVYVGTAQGGVYRSLNGGTTWTAIFDNAASLAIGALALAPSNPTILYVGTGEPSLSCDSYFGVGLYRIDGADTAPVLNGPFNPTPTTDVLGAKTFTGRSISQILVDAANPATIFVSTSSGIGGMGCDAYGASPPVTALRGIYRSTTGTSGSPSFQKLTVTTAGSIAPDVSGNRIVSDMIYDPTDATGNTIVCWVYGNAAALDGGIYRTTNALAATPTFSQTFTTTVSSSRGAFAANRVSGVTTMIVGTGESAAGTGCTSGSGCLRRSTDGGLTWSAKLAGGGGYCGGQCWYDLPVAIHPTNASIILIGGAGNGTCSRVYARSTNAGASFTGAGGADVGLHADAHAIAFAPSNPSIVYEGNDGGIYKSTDAGATWASLNNSGFSATQFQSLAIHPLDRWFTIGGTQDNGTPWLQNQTTWYRADWGDGGFSLIDQNATDNTNVTMYHTYYNATSSLVGYARVIGSANAYDGNWTFLGNGANGIGISDGVLFYAPMARGPGNPNTVYYGTDRLYRSANQGTNHSVVSQAPITSGAKLSAIGISPQNDNVRIVGLNNGQVWMTQTGSSTLTNVTSASFPVSATSTRYVARAIIDPNNTNTAWVSFGGFGMPAGQHVWKTTNLAGGATTWAAAGSGIPDVPVNALCIDPMNSNDIYAGTDIGPYRSTDGGASWSPYTTGMPVVAVFDMAIQNFNRTLRCATHGRGMWERLLDSATPALVSLVGSEVRDGHVLLSWYSASQAGRTANLYRRYVPGEWQKLAALSVDGAGHLDYDDADVLSYGTYEYRLGFSIGGREEFVGAVTVDVGGANRLALRGVYPNPTTEGMLVTFTLPNADPARIEIVDATGRRVSSRQVGAMGVGQHQLDLRRERFAPGIYWVRLVQGDRMFTAKAAVVR
ncbi:MAG: T9SS type A sorting domain-containing protein [Candidatus Eisenbacteria bacterium]|nr:T9SS type A sorting domain-containing protein [Candidatus Eisenbacteria bacterium]